MTEMNKWKTVELLREFDKDIVFSTFCAGTSVEYSIARRVLLSMGDVVLELVIEFLYDSLPTEKFNRNKEWINFMQDLKMKIDPVEEGPKASIDPLNWIDWGRGYLEKKSI